MGAGPVEPRRGNEARDRLTDDILDEGASVSDPLARLRPRQAQEFAFPGGQEPRPKTVETAMFLLIAMIVAVKEYFDAAVGPAAQPGSEWRTGANLAGPPMIGYDQHGQSGADEGLDLAHQPVDLRLETRRDVVDRCEEEALRFPWHRASLHPPASEGN